MLSFGFKPPNHDELGYGPVRNTLCSQILQMLDETIENEVEGLDLYIDVFPTVNGVVQDFDDDVNYHGDNDAVQVVYAMKKKSNPEC